MDRHLTWERLPDEGARAYHAFAHFRDLGPGRSLLKAWVAHKSSCEHVTPPPRRRVPKRLEVWSVQHRWVERVSAFDADVDKQVREKRSAEIIATLAKHIRLASAIESAGASLLKTFLEIAPTMLPRVAADASKSTRAFFDLYREIRGFASVLPAAVSVERLALGLTTASIAMAAQPPDLRFAEEVARNPVATELAIALLDELAGTRPQAREADEPHGPDWQPPAGSGNRSVH